MLDERQFWVLTATGILAILLAVANMILFTENRALQKEATERAQFVQQSVALEGLYREIVQALAQRAVRTRDDQVRAFLADQGITLTFDAPGAGSAP